MDARYIIFYMKTLNYSRNIKIYHVLIALLILISLFFAYYWYELSYLLNFDNAEHLTADQNLWWSGLGQNIGFNILIGIIYFVVIYIITIILRLNRCYSKLFRLLLSAILAVSFSIGGIIGTAQGVIDLQKTTFQETPKGTEINP